jgi:hypothetical protein
MRMLFFMLSLLSTNLYAQNGYIKWGDDSMRVGYLRTYVALKNGQQGIELWRTKKDKLPLKIPKAKISEYAIKKDTFKVLHQYKPFPNRSIYFELVDAKLKVSGKVNLYIIENFHNANRVSNYTVGGLIPAIIDEGMGNFTFLYILEDRKTGFIKAMSSRKEELMESLLDFFPENYIIKYGSVKGEIKYRSLPEVVKLYNSK